MQWLMVIISLLAGVALAFQAGINGDLGKKIGLVEAAFVSFSIGAIVLFLAMIFMGKGNILQLMSVPKWQLTGGILGAFIVLSMVLSVPKIGVAITIVSIIAGQLITSMILDSTGMFSGRQIQFDLNRMLAVFLIGIALYLIYKN
ncbi:integral membrane protein [Halalkalibacter wakoensis JCM 9140]|uniref:Integral membrane protein n=1 Tax=Halalkalibacter wakoensis JCM 9140 TaxID=1236970 RepID=W4Q1L4_9BACI|nr:DMT family transporter [Halalkalibacter wakoensis]GAE25941.1 integral membrane protein [Halalkalibacter wakoensis JCM 9140]